MTSHERQQWEKVLMFANWIDKKLDTEIVCQSSISGITHDAGERAQWIARIARNELAANKTPNADITGR